MTSAAAPRPIDCARFRPRTGEALGAALVLAAMTAAAPAFADSVADAKDLFARGRELRRSGDCSSAIWAFRKAYDLYPEGLGSLRNVAECEEALGRFASSRRDWLDLRRALGNNPPDRYDGWARDAEEAASRLSPRLSTLLIDVGRVGEAGDASRAGVRVKINDEWLSPAMFGVPLERDPGQYVVRVVRSGALDEVHIVDLAPGDAKTVSIATAPARANGTGELSAGAPGDRIGDDGTRDATWRIAGWSAVGVGVAALAGAGVSFWVRQSALGDLDSLCPGRADGRPCPPSTKGAANADSNRGNVATTLADVFGIAGLAAVTGGVIFLLTHPRRGSQSLQVAAGVSGSGIWAVGSF